MLPYVFTEHVFSRRQSLQSHDPWRPFRLALNRVLD